jgi:lipopolysaccharide export system permease protein
MLKIYQNYLLKAFSRKLFLVSLIFLALSFILNIFEEINFFKDKEVNLLTPFFLTFLNIPSTLYEAFPFIFLISAQYFFIEIIDNSELNIYKNYGIDNFKILKLISFTSLIYGILIVLLFYNFSSKLKFLYLDIKNQYSEDNKYLALITENGIWIKDDLNNKTNIISANRIENDYLYSVSIVQFDKEFNLIQNIISEKVFIKDTTWMIEKALISKNNLYNKPINNLEFETNFDTEKINTLFSNLSSLTFMQLIKLKKDYKLFGYSTLEIDTHNNKIIAYPFYLMIMTMLSIIMMMNIKHNKTIIKNVILGILLSVSIYYINYFSNLLGQNGKLPVMISIWMPLFIISIFVTMGLVRFNEK